VTLVLDAAPLVALADRHDPWRDAVRAALHVERMPLVIASPVTAEVDCLLGRRVGRAARLAFLDDLAAERFTVECLLPEEYPAVADLERRYTDLDIGLADAATVVLAARLRTHRVLTFDERHFRAIRPLDGGAFHLLPDR
jgi:predicted nucleic acid-binding protein